MAYVNISIEQMRHAFGKTSTQGRRWVEGVQQNEIVFDFAFRHNVVIRVYTSVPATSHVSRKKGLDAIRVVAFNPVTNKGIAKVPHVKRMENWRDHLGTRIERIKALVIQRMGPPTA